MRKEPHHDEKKRKRRRRGGVVHGSKPHARLDRKARGERDALTQASDAEAVKDDQRAKDTKAGIPPPKVSEPTKAHLEPLERAKGGGIHIKPSHKGLLHKDLGVPEGEKIPAAKIEKAKHSDNPKIRKRATFAENFGH